MSDLIDYMDACKRQKEYDMEMKVECFVCKKLFDQEDATFVEFVGGGHWECLGCNTDGVA